MPSLRELQRAFAAGVYEEAPGILAALAPGHFGAARHLQVYRNNTFANLGSALAAVYPVVQRLVGEGFFGFAADRYIRAHPPRAGNLHEFGADFAAFLAGFEPACALVYLPDVARLEWAWHRAFHAGDHPPLSLARLGTVSEAEQGRLRFRLHPSAQVLESDYPILRIWQVNQPDHTGELSVQLAEGGVRLLVIRRGLTVAIEPLAPGEFALLSALAAGESLAAAFEAAIGTSADLDLAAALRRHVVGETLVDFSLPSAAVDPNGGSHDIG